MGRTMPLTCTAQTTKLMEVNVLLVDMKKMVATVFAIVIQAIATFMMLNNRREKCLEI